jgi:predicted O-methyltransferase YrrM
VGGRMLPSMPRAKASVTEEIGEYLARHSRQDAVLARVERETAERADAGMQITPDEGGLLTMLATLTGAERALELGTFTGYSAICIARGLPPNGTLTCLELQDEFAAIARRNLEAAGVAHKVEIRVGPADEALRNMPEEPTFDFVFLDADKTGYPAYYELIVPRLEPGGLLLVDNVLLRGTVTDPEDDRARAIDQLNARIAEDERVDSVMVLVADGLTFVRRR